MNHVMLDIETLGTFSDNVVLAIGAVLFNEEQVYEEHWFYDKVEIQPQLDKGRTVEGSTLLWWMEQPDQARLEAVKTPMPPVVVLNKWNYWLRDMSMLVSKGEDLRVWGNGSDFDNVILQNLFQTFQKEPVWTHKANRCYRTMKNVFPVEWEDKGVKHVALDDAKAQAHHLVKICQTYNIELR